MNALELAGCILLALWACEAALFCITYCTFRRSARGSAPSPQQRPEDPRP